jgi:hypothetical protein
MVKVEVGVEAIRTIVDAGVGVWAQLRGQGAGGSGQGAVVSGQGGGGEWADS